MGIKLRTVQVLLAAIPGAAAAQPDCSNMSKDGWWLDIESVRAHYTLTETVGVMVLEIYSKDR